ncbi:hypothetical protein SAMN02990966_03650 [Rhodospirillales bacterium URHD0017]|nr:hypothetical protein SAMN02990966_03650 [Rhodospirillales bacterium URHD0017]
MRPVVLLLLVLTMSLAALAQQRFDFKVREDMFAGMDGDTVAFDRAMTLIADTLAKDPDHAEALVWRGDGRLFLAGQAFQRRDFSEGLSLTAQGLSDMDRAVSLAPDNIAVRVPRAAGLLPFARGMRSFNPAEADRLTRSATTSSSSPPVRHGGPSSTATARARCWARWPTDGCSWVTSPRPISTSIA